MINARGRSDLTGMMVDSTAVDPLNAPLYDGFILFCAASMPLAAHRYFTRGDGSGIDHFPCSPACDIPLSNNPAVQMVAFWMARGATDNEIGWQSIMEFAAHMDSPVSQGGQRTQ